jgi:CRISPR-associated protein Csm1
MGIEYLQRFSNEILLDNNILNAIKYHHAKQLKSADLNSDSIAYIVYEADNIAAGTDRRADTEQEEIEYKNKCENFDKNQCLKPVNIIL